MKLRKGMVLVFAAKNRPNEVILKASSDPIGGMIVTDHQQYSVDFINRWMHLGFCRAFKAKDLPTSLVK